MPLFHNVGIPELILLIVLALIIFGPGRVAQLGSELGKGIRGFKEGLESINAEDANNTPNSTSALPGT